MILEKVLPQQAIALFVLIYLSIPLYPSSAFGGRPLVIDDAAPVAEGRVELELGFSHSRPPGGGREQRWPAMGLTYGLTEGLEFGVNIHRINSDLKGEAPVEGLEDLHLATKYNVLEESVDLPALAFSFDLKTPTANRRKGLSSGRVDEHLTLIATKRFSPVALDLNLGYLIVNSPLRDQLKNRFLGGLALRRDLDKQWSLVGEILGQSRKASGEKNEAHLQIGARYLFALPIVFDAAVGRSLRPSGTRIQATFGLTWTFPVSF